VRQKLDEFEVENPKQAMQNFKDALRQVVSVPKDALDKKRKRAKAKRLKKRKA
jgi:hypothetical protein